MGSPTLVPTLLSEGLVDELQLVVMPVLLGGGKTIFPDDGGKRPMELVSTTTAKTGAQVCGYRRRRPRGSREVLGVINSAHQHL